MTGNPLAAHKSSDTLYILGSGASINELRAQEWEQIAAADSIGFNFWLLHDFVPSLYVFEFPRKETPEYQCLLANLAARSKDYAGRPILVKDGERHRMAELRGLLASLPEKSRENLSLAWDWEIPGHDRQRFAQDLLRLDRFGILAGGHYPIIRKRASVFFLALLGLRAGYKKIVLCGIDLNNNAYFYESRHAEYAAKGRSPPPSKPFSAVHKTNDPGDGAVTISHALAVLDREVLRPAGVELYVAFRSSGLHPQLPAFFGR